MSTSTRPPASALLLGLLLGAGLSLVSASASAQSAACMQDSEGVRLLADRIAFEQPIAFVTASDQIAPASLPAVQAIARRLRRCSSLQIEIQVHTDSRGSSAFNLRISHARAQSLLNALVRAGAPPRNLVACGYGETQPIDSNMTAEGRNKNRRVVLFRLSGPAYSHRCSAQP